MAEKTSFIKLDRNILRWRWYKDANVFRVFIYLLITAAYKDTEINGITLRRGQCLTTYKELANNHNLSFQTIRTAIAKLKDTGEITIERKLRKMLITLTAYEHYQGHYNLAFFVDMTNNYFDENQHLLSGKSTFTKTLKKPLDSLINSGEFQDTSTFTFGKINNHFSENQQSKEESNQRRNLRNNYFNYISKNINNNTPPLTCALRDNINYILYLYHSICVDYSRVKALSAPIIEELARSLEIYSLEEFKEMFVKAETSHCLRGKNKVGRRATFDWLINADNMAKILNGNYDDLPNENSSFENDEFFEAALKKSYENIGDKKHE